jgi:hypothetical protein
MSREIFWFMLVVNHRFADEVLRQRLMVRMRIAHDEPPVQALPPALPENAATSCFPLPPTPGRRVASEV